jgi:hypothetical protein
MHPGPVLSSTFDLGLPSDPTPADFYGRSGNPTWRALEAAIGELDGGECVVFASGMAAIAAVLRLAGRDGALVLPSDGYYLARSLAHGELAPLGIEVRETPTAAPLPPLDGAALVLLETPSNPGLDVADIAAAAATAHAAGALLAVDNPPATPLGQRPLELGADLVIASDTKALAGHGDVVARRVRAAERCQGRWRHGSPTAVSPPSTCGSSGRRATPPRSSPCCVGTPPSPTCGGRATPPIPRTPSRRGRCGGGTACCGSHSPPRTPSRSSSPPRG